MVKPVGRWVEPMSWGVGPGGRWVEPGTRWVGPAGRWEVLAGKVCDTHKQMA